MPLQLHLFDGLDLPSEQMRGADVLQPPHSPEDQVVKVGFVVRMVGHIAQERLRECLGAALLREVPMQPLCVRQDRNHRPYEYPRHLLFELALLSVDLVVVLVPVDSLLIDYLVEGSLFLGEEVGDLAEVLGQVRRHKLARFRVRLRETDQAPEGSDSFDVALLHGQPQELLGGLEIAFEPLR